MTKLGKWEDLAVRMGSGALLALSGLFAVWAGGHIFHALISIVCGAMVWELMRLLDPTRVTSSIVMGVLSALVVMVASYLPWYLAGLLLLCPVLIGIVWMDSGRKRFTIFGVAVMIAGLGIIMQRDDVGIVWLAFIILVVVITDVAGYFVGRSIGGPKFWPAVSPSKTWSGTIGGWVGALALGLYFSLLYGGGGVTVLVAFALSIASQMGDIAESAIKRQVGVKDSSHLIPGHGGVLDRFDGMLGASLMLLVIEALIDFPPM
ncbi:MAG: phosphatidate cytidylyltransferase [Marinovum sp.]|nr:phosphatidate cytidylyltransferase [Marinovum sp.]